ncbi:MAG: uracil-DNA glycosylase [Clostridiaceae bacterium]|nr:uracil-DNA glycosylase [Clostridiaceae bacterium]
MEIINCRKCKNFYITWDKNFPFGCRKLNFKSKKLPSVNVFESSGEQCLYFEHK